MEELINHCQFALKQFKWRHVTMEQPHVDAMQECYRRARAWDELRAWAGSKTLDRMCAKMDELIPPEPVDKLERLYGWVKQFDVLLKVVAVDDVIAKIREIQES